MANSFLDKTGLTYLWGKIVALVNRKQDALTFDSTPTDNSTNPVTSGGVKAYVDANAGGSGDSPVESGSGTGSVQTKAYTVGSSTFTQTASGQGAFAEGCKTVASGMDSHAEGSSTTASGDYSHAEGISTQALKNFSHAEGNGTIANGLSQHVEGRWNLSSSNYAHITGIGTDNNNRRNGFTVDWSGNGFFRGRLEVSNSGFSGWTDSTVVTKKYFDELSKTTVLLEDSNDSYQVTLPSEGTIWSGHILVAQDLTYGPYPFVGHDYSTLRDHLYRYALEYYTEGLSGDSDRHLIPLTKVEVLSEASGNMYAKMVFGNNEKTYLAGGEGYTCWIPESEWTPGSEFPYPSGE